MILQRYSINMLRLLVVGIMMLASSASLQASADDTFRLVVSLSQLHDGDEVIIVNRESSVALSVDEEKFYVKPCAVNLSSDGTQASLASANTAVLNVEKQSTGWRFRHADKGWLWASDRVNYQLCFDNDRPSYKSNVAKVTVDGGGDAIIAFDVKNYKYLRYNGSDRFACYPSTYSVEAVSIYRRQRRVDALLVSEDADNSKAIAGALGCLVGETTLQRTFKADGGYYSLCLPFSVSGDEVSAAMPGAVFMELRSVEAVGEDKVAFRFAWCSSVKAGKPYLVRLDGDDIINPVFRNSTIDEADPADATFTLQGKTYVFRGTFDRVALKANGSTRFVSSDGTRLVTPNTDGQLHSMRAYFVMPDVQTGSSFSQADANESYSITFSSTTSLGECRAPLPAKGDAYNLSGLPVDMKSRGLKIVDGRKYVVR